MPPNRPPEVRETPDLRVNPGTDGVLAGEPCERVGILRAVFGASDDDGGTVALALTQPATTAIVAVAVKSESVD
jgi:hypothetical protein